MDGERLFGSALSSGSSQSLPAHAAAAAGNAWERERGVKGGPKTSKPEVFTAWEMGLSLGLKWQNCKGKAVCDFFGSPRRSR